MAVARSHFTRQGKPKVGYLTMRAAWDACNLHGNLNKEVYKCSYCDLYHYGERQRRA